MHSSRSSPFDMRRWSIDVRLRTEMFSFYGGGGVVVVFQIICIVHAVRTRNASWIWIILFFPLVGSLIYLATEVRGVGRSGRKLAGQLANAVQPSRRLDALRAQLADAPTVANRLALSEECARLARFEEALELLATTGAHKNDPEVLKRRAAVQFEMGKPADAKATLEHLFDAQPRERGPAMRLLFARVVEAEGDAGATLAAYEAAAPGAIGDELRYRRAAALERTGRAEDARALYTRIVKESARADGRYRRANREWIQAAKARLDEPAGPPPPRDA